MTDTVKHMWDQVEKARADGAFSSEHAAVPAQCDAASDAEHFGQILKDEAARLRKRADELDTPSPRTPAEPEYGHCTCGRSRADECDFCKELSGVRTPAECCDPPYEELRKTNVELMAKLREARSEADVFMQSNGALTSEVLQLRAQVENARAKAKQAHDLLDKEEEFGAQVVLAQLLSDLRRAAHTSTMLTPEETK